MKPAIIDVGEHSTDSNLLPKSSPSQSRTSSYLRWLESTLFAWLPAISFTFMVYSSITAIYQSKGDPSTITFVAGSISILGGLYWCMQEFEKAVALQATARKERLKVTIWVLAMALNTLFSYRVTSVMNSAVFSVIIWSIAGVTTVVGWYLMFFSTPGFSDGSAVPL